MVLEEILNHSEDNGHNHVGTILELIYQENDVELVSQPNTTQFN